MALKVSSTQLGDLRELDVHPLRALLKTIEQQRIGMEADRAAFLGALEALMQQLPAALAKQSPPNVNVQAPQQSARRLRVNRNSAGFIQSIDIITDTEET